MPFEVGKKYLTRGGEEARVYATDGSVNRPIHGAIFGDKRRPGGWYSTDWTNTGRYHDPSRESAGDLMGYSDHRASDELKACALDEAREVVADNQEAAHV